MKITKIEESGSNNILRWAILNGADLKNDIPLQSIINGETYYIVSISEINLFELFRLSQVYREKVRITDAKPASIPQRKLLHDLFSGEYASEDDPNNKVPLCELVEYATNGFLNLAQQMHADDDIIRPNIVPLFLPMITRLYDVQIPISFIDVLNSSISDPVLPEFQSIFNEDYPNTLNSIIESESSGIRNAIKLDFLKLTSIVKRNPRYDKLLDVVKFARLSKTESSELYKFALTGFYKYDNISRSECRCELFKANKEEISQKIKRMKILNTPLHVEFAVQIPIALMQIVENSFSNEELGVSFESSMSSIIENGLEFHNFITHEYEEGTPEAESYNNGVEMYRTRIASANQTLLNTLSILLNHEGDIDITSAFAMLPGLYNTKAIVTLDLSQKQKYLNHYDDTVKAMLAEMVSISEGILSNNK